MPELMPCECNAERWHAPRLSLHESLLEFPDRRLQNGPAASKEPLFKWDLDITRTSTEDLVSGTRPQTALLVLTGSI